MITNRDIASEDLLEAALAEVVENARDNGVDEETIATELRDRAADLAGPD